MSHTLRVVLVLALGIWAPPRWRRAVPVAAVGLWSPPLAALGAGITGIGRLWRRAGARRRDSAARGDQVELLAELLGLGLSAGWGFGQALAWSARRLDQPLRGEVEAVLRRVRHEGPTALDRAEGSAADLYRLVARAQTTGAPVAEAVDDFAAARLEARRQEALTAARRLPVVLVFPLALLILPGFVLVTVAPALLGAVERIGS